MSDLVGLLDIYNSLSYLSNSLNVPSCSKDVEEAALNYFNYVKKTDFEYSKVAIFVVKSFIDAEVEHARMDIINAYNNLTDSLLDYSDKSFDIAYNYIFNKEKYNYLESEITILYKRLIEEPYFKDTFLFNNLEFIVAIMNSLSEDIDLNVFDTDPDVISDFKVYSLVLEVLNNISPVLVEVFTTMGADIIPFDENNYELIVKRYNIDPSYLSNTAFYIPSINKIFYERTSTLFDVAAILHEFGHTLSGNITSNALSEMIPIIFEKCALKLFKTKGYSKENINDALIFRNVHVYEIISNLSFIFELLFRHAEGLTLIETGEYDNDALLNKTLDMEIKGLNSGETLANIYNTYPYVIAYFIANNLDDPKIIIKWMEEGITPEEVFKYLGYNVSGDDTQVLS